MYSNTVHVIPYFLTDFLVQRGKSADFEALPEDELASLLREFYASVRNKEGNTYSRSGYQNL